MKFFAQGEILNESAEVALEKTIKTTKQVRVLITGLKGILNAACEALGFNQATNPDKLVNEWLDKTVPDSIEDANKLATDIVSKHITDNLKRYE